MSRLQGDLLREYDRKFANLPDDLRLISLCSDAGFIKTVAESGTDKIGLS